MYTVGRALTNSDVGMLINKRSLVLFNPTTDLFFKCIAMLDYMK